MSWDIAAVTGLESFTARWRAVVPGGVAQLEERLVCNQKVVGSNPVASTRIECAASCSVCWPSPALGE